MASQVFLHVGAPLAPAALSDTLALHRRRLARAGVLYPHAHLGHDGGHGEAVLDVLGLAAHDEPTAGAWDRLAGSIGDWRRGTAVVSHELLAAASASQVERVVSSLGGAEVHVVYVARDLGRQIPRAWQRWVHAGGTVPFSTYAARVLGREPHRCSRVFWRFHDLGAVLSRWGKQVPAERMHVVTAPRGDDDARAAWRRFAQTVGADPDRHRAATVGEDDLAALAGTDVVRLINSADLHCTPEGLASLVRRAQTVEGLRPHLPSALREAVGVESDRMVNAVRSHGWHLVGSEEDLRVAGDAFATQPGEITPAAEDVALAQAGIILELCAERERAGPAGIRRRALRALRARVRP